MVHLFQLIQMDRITQRLASIEDRLARTEHLERTVERLSSSAPSSVVLSNACLIELKQIASQRMNGVGASPYHCENENKEILRFLRQNPTSYRSLQAFIKDGTAHEERVGTRFAELITNAKSARKKLLVPKSSSILFLPSMSTLDDWTRTLFDARVEEPAPEHFARAAFLRFYRDHGHLLMPKINGDAPSLACNCTGAYEHLPVLAEYHAKRTPEIHARMVASFAKKAWLLSGFWRDFDKAIEEVYQHPQVETIIQQVVELDRAKYTLNTKAQGTGSTDSAHLVPPRERPMRRSTDTSMVSVGSVSSYEGIGTYGSPTAAEDDWFAQTRSEEDA
nr:hypothetical protein HK105_004045 [Polyrhizophydium stewartii]